MVRRTALESAPPKAAKASKAPKKTVNGGSASALEAAAEPAASEVPLTLSERVAETLRRKITEGEFAPGQRLSEQALSESLAISRNTLREVFRTLTKDGLLKHAPNRGVSVAIPSIASIIDIYRVRRLVECQALAQAYPRHPAKKRMREAVETAVRCRDRHDWLGVGTANMAFHQAIVELADSERLNTLFAPVLAELRLAFGLLRDSEFLHAPYVDMNSKILELAEAGEFARASAELGDYLVHSERIVLAVYARRIQDGGLELA
ncbi:MAG: GntR family transcriptional regulator [Pelomonas sp.]|nr:GntR family transcriptional regulator [Roseateles sp.]